MVTKDELKKMKAADLDKEIAELTTERLRLRLAVSTRQSAETDKLKKMRKNIARAKTLKHQQMVSKDKAPANPKTPVTK